MGPLGFNEILIILLIVLLLFGGKKIPELNRFYKTRGDLFFIVEKKWR